MTYHLCASPTCLGECEPKLKDTTMIDSSQLHRVITQVCTEEAFISGTYIINRDEMLEVARIVHGQAIAEIIEGIVNKSDAEIIQIISNLVKEE